uniref:Uncharacterized protein n=1 Tax=Siphoviridae sp. ctNYt19 TaxID=2825472 RepID=A0A8S5QJH4_9CAUD|nr:MAG TPA: hypothetical protein [Siphoviridae sp. ctNYt19]DAT22444.1 MAG TPA: hypothetical protein [Caudoviricetes sp.]
MRVGSFFIQKNKIFRKNTLHSAVIMLIYKCRKEVR